MSGRPPFWYRRGVAEASAFDPQQALLDWYAREQRDLPWRREPSPYRVLVSELMLQQTQVDRVIPYFERFLDRFPTLEALAGATRASVIEAWGGLGYNRRAVYLHRLAQAVCERYLGILPRDRKALLALPGIGPYTAGAILSIGFGEDASAIDTNVQRVLSRYHGRPGPSPSELDALARSLVPPGGAGDWNQALMDLGAAVCRARAPRCLQCPLRAGCRGASDPAIAPKRRQGRFEESTRYYRGRLVAALRSLAPSQTEALSGTVRRLTDLGIAEPATGWETVAKALARDGLAEIQDSPDGPTIRLPT